MKSGCQKQGRGDSTPHKLEGLSKILHQNLGIGSVKYRDWPYFHFDLTAGCGFNIVDDKSYAGSPLIFLQEATSWHRHNVCATFIDNNPEACRMLMRTLVEYSDYQGPMGLVNYDCFTGGDLFDFVCTKHGQRCCMVEIPLPDNSVAWIKCDDNRNVLKNSMLAMKPKNSNYFGSMTIDPNGAKMPLKEMRDFLREWARIDLILVVSATQIKRNRGAFPRTVSLRLADFEAYFGKRYNWIHAPDDGDHWQRVIIVSRNFMPQSMPNGFLPWSEARDLLEWLDKSERERHDKQSRLFNLS